METRAIRSRHRKTARVHVQRVYVCPLCRKEILGNGYYVHKKSCGDMKSIKERLYAKIEMIPESGCWIWMGAISSCGYGTLDVEGKSQRDAMGALQAELEQVKKERDEAMSNLASVMMNAQAEKEG